MSKRKRTNDDEGVQQPKRPKRTFKTCVEHGGATDPGSRYGDLNQDDYFVDKFLTPEGYIHLFCVFDGHGKNGEVASKVAKEETRSFLKSELQKNPAPSKKDQDAMIKTAFKRAHDAIIKEYPKLQTITDNGVEYKLTDGEDGQYEYSAENGGTFFLHDFGTTAVIVIYFENKHKMVIGSVGDSFAVIGSIKQRRDVMGKTDEWDYSAHTLNENDNCEEGLQSELKRIRRSFRTKAAIDNGYIHPINSPYDWHCLAMTRALGHKYLVKCGVIWEPHITYYTTLPEDLTLIVASDGLWDVAIREDVVQYALSEEPQQAAQTLVDKALEWWKIMPTYDPEEDSDDEHDEKEGADKDREEYDDSEDSDEMPVTNKADNTTVVVVRLQPKKDIKELIEKCNGNTTE